jgi:hypothetical protein
MTATRTPRVRHITLDGITKSVEEWAKLIEVTPSVIYTRMRRGDSPLQCLRQRDYQRKPKEGLWTWIQKLPH